MRRNVERGQSILEFALCLGMVAGVLASMALYIQRGIQARYHAAVLNCVKNATTKPQYEPYYTREAQREETTQGNRTTGWNTMSWVNIDSSSSSTENIPLPARWERDTE